VLPTGTKYDYACSVCGAQVGGKTDSDSSEFHRIASASRRSLPSGPAQRSSRSTTWRGIQRADATPVRDAVLRGIRAARSPRSP